MKSHFCCLGWVAAYPQEGRNCPSADNVRSVFLFQEILRELYHQLIFLFGDPGYVSGWIDQLKPFCESVQRILNFFVSWSFHYSSAVNGCDVDFTPNPLGFSFQASLVNLVVETRSDLYTIWNGFFALNKKDSAIPGSSGLLCLLKLWSRQPWLLRSKQVYTKRKPPWFELQLGLAHIQLPLLGLRNLQRLWGYWQWRLVGWCILNQRHKKIEWRGKRRKYIFRYKRVPNFGLFSECLLPVWILLFLCRWPSWNKGPSS